MVFFFAVGAQAQRRNSRYVEYINLFPNFVTLIVETNPLTYMRDLTITAIIKVYQQSPDGYAAFS